MGAAPLVVNVTQPRDSDTFKCYAFNFYDPTRSGSRLFGDLQKVAREEPGRPGRQERSPLPAVLLC